MRSLERNKRLIHYALFTGKTASVDEYGNFTGDYELTYGDPMPVGMNVSAAKGKYSTLQFGGLELYDKVMVTADMNCPITETTRLWVETVPRDAENNVTPHDYVVTGVARGLNSISYAVKKVSVGGYDIVSNGDDDEND